jgi:hypothetical protein
VGIVARNEPQIGFHWKLTGHNPQAVFSGAIEVARRTLGIRRDHSMGAGSSGNRPTIEKPIAKTRTLRTITANMSGARFSAPETPYCIGSVASTPAARPRGMAAQRNHNSFFPSPILLVESSTAGTRIAMSKADRQPPGQSSSGPSGTSGQSKKRRTT